MRAMLQADAQAVADLLTVSEYSALLGRALRRVGPARIEGEVQKVSRTATGMLFFELTDGESVLACKIFAREASRLGHVPRAGDLVQVAVQRPDLYAARGSLSLIVTEVALAGEGELLRRRAELLERLRAEGLCDPARRRPLPRFPRAVGVIAGEASDGMSDVVRALKDRWPAVTIVTCPSLVQGKAAPAQLVDALARLQQHPLVDVIVIARGGGSVQDLACFDDERLCRAMFACERPVVCAIGHTDNDPVCNHVAWAAYTPSRSAELVVPSAAQIREQIATCHERLASVPRRLALARERIDGRTVAVVGDFLTAHERSLAGARGALASVPDRARARLEGGSAALLSAHHALAGTAERVAEFYRRLAELGSAVREQVHGALADRERELAHRAQLIAARDFRRRGWVLLGGTDGRPVGSIRQLRAGARVALHLHDGRAEALVTNLTAVEGSSHE